MIKRNEDLEKKALSLMLQNEERQLREHMQQNGMKTRQEDEYESEYESEEDEQEEYDDDMIMAMKMSAEAEGVPFVDPRTQKKPKPAKPTS